MIFVNILCGKSYFGKKSVSFLFHLPTLKLSSEASSKPFFDRLDIFPDAIDLKNTMAVSILVLHRPLVRSEKKYLFVHQIIGKRKPVFGSAEWWELIL